MPRPITQGTKLADRMELLGIKSVDITRATGIDQWLMNDYLNRRGKPSPETMIKLCRYLKCQPGDIFD